ncbi:cytochrome P450 4C1-like isoform X2 [Pseudomyrmex gracilis]|uniref:cytochrome P450 4C1-like isoform X2 n=1 Tax=Pseudomyrmex gracilis TaxID=219809 RepID=UPI000995D503|nr:cytochrome P450 4C1-like isoform X2 [Pseudomyrmex gracilis]
MIEVLLFIIFLISIYHFYLHYGKTGRLINLIPGPRTIPILGNSLLFNVPLDKLWQVICKLQNQYYPIVRVWIFHMPWIIICHPDDIKALVGSMKHNEKGVVYNLSHCWIRTGLLTSGGNKWRTRRNLLTPTFHHNILKNFVDSFVEEANKMIMVLKNSRRPVVKKLWPFVSEYTLNSICETSMGISINNSTDSKNYRDAIEQMNDILMYRGTRPWLYKEWINALFPIGKKQKKLLNTLHGFTEKIIAERKHYHELTGGRYLKPESEYDTEINDTKRRRMAFLDLLIAANHENKLTDLDIREEVNTFTAAGYETTTNGICFALMLLAKHKNIQDRVRLEVNTMIEENGNKFTISSLQKLSYLDNVIKEVLRLYPSVLLISRVTTEDVKLQSYTIPSGTNIFININATHKDPNFWPNPEVFDPDRFLPKECQSRHPYSYLPFSAGPRNCIGQRYANLQLKVVIALLVQNFYLEPVDLSENIEIMMKISISPTRPLYVRFVPIDIQ